MGSSGIWVISPSVESNRQTETLVAPPDQAENQTPSGARRAPSAEVR
jgi:hypothetical protein